MSSPTTVRQDDLHLTIEQALRQRLDAGLAAASAHGEAFAGLWRTVAEHATGGKLLRPLLLLDAHEALSGGDLHSQAVDVAVNLELLHYAFLLHDDVIDGDLTRRFRPNLIGTLATGGDDRDLHWARSAALLAGDALISTALLGFARVDLDAALRTRLLDVVEGIVLETIAGEHLDVALSHGRSASDLQTILAMTARKTAAYSFALPLRAAAILADLPLAAEESLASAGRHLGLAFQIQDDLLSAFGDACSHGKDDFSDLREGKETALVAYARMTSGWAAIAPHFGSSALTAADAEQVREHLRACGAEAFAEGLVAENLDAAASVLDDARSRGIVDESISALVHAFADRIRGRRS